ncbi:Uncharacterised protein [Mycolicibacterium flavescens]|nr:Uncharacterised protein [Mycolicibacterium flavescens]
MSTPGPRLRLVDTRQQILWQGLSKEVGERFLAGGQRRPSVHKFIRIEFMTHEETNRWNR